MDKQQFNHSPLPFSYEPSGRVALEDLQRAHQRDADALMVILRLLPTELTPEQDQVLYRLYRLFTEG